MRCLVTGGCGFIGTRLVDKLVKEGCHVTVVDLKASKRPLHKQVVYRFMDINEIDALSDRFDVIFHLAAVSSISASEKDPLNCYRVNVLGTASVLEKAKRDGSKVMFASTCAVYDCAGDLSNKILSHYQSSKLMGEILCNTYDNAKIFRIFNVYGPGDNKGVVAIFSHQKENFHSLSIAGDGSSLRDYVYVDDVVKVLYRMGCVVNFNKEYVDICTGVLTSVAQVAEMFGVKFGSMEGFNTIPLPDGQNYHSPVKEPPLDLCGNNFMKLEKYIGDWIQQKAEEFVPF